MARSGDPEPGGRSFGFGVVAGNGIDRNGNVASRTASRISSSSPWGATPVYRNGPSGTRASVVPGQTPAPGGGRLVGAGESTSTNDQGTVAFAGIIPTPHGISDDLGMGVFLRMPDGSLQPLVVPGTAASGGSTFDYAALLSINAAGDVAFTAHMAGTPSETGSPQWLVIGCHSDDLFVHCANRAQVERLVTRGTGAPGGGTFIDVLNPSSATTVTWCSWASSPPTQ